MNFFIKQNSTLPELKFPLTQKLMEKYGITKDMLENVAITFSMIDSESGLYKIANVGADIVFTPNRAENPSEEAYTLVYRFSKNDTHQTGRFSAEFSINFLGESCGEIKLPENDEINVVISNALTKTSVI